MDQVGVVEVFKDKSALSVGDNAARVGFVSADAFGRDDGSRRRSAVFVFDNPSDRAVIWIRYQVRQGFATGNEVPRIHASFGVRITRRLGRNDIACYGELSQWQAVTSFPVGLSRMNPN